MEYQYISLLISPLCILPRCEKYTVEYESQQAVIFIQVGIFGSHYMLADRLTTVK